MKKYLIILFEPFFEKKGQYLFHIFISISLLLISLGSIELIRRLILSIENNVGFESTALYGVFATILIIVVFGGKLYFSYLRPHNMVSIQNFLFRKYLNNYILLDNEKVNNYGNGKFINIINSGVISTGEILYLLLFEIIVIIVGYMLSITMIGYINVYLILPVICITILLFLAMSYTSDKTFSYRKERKILREQLSKQTLKILMEKFTILKNGKGKEEVQKIIDINDDTMPVGRKVTFYIRLLEEGAQMIIDSGEIILILILGYFIYQNTSSFADIGALLFIMALIKKNINSLSIYYRQITNMQNDFTRLVDIFAEIEPIKNYESGEKFEFKAGKIEIKSLGYAYPDGKNVFNKLNLYIPEKSQVAFIGKSGSGKSTLVKLILAFIEKQSGSILIDDQELGDIALKGYYKHIGYLQQETSVFDGTILENIMYGSDIIQDKKKLNTIIEQSACGFIYDLPKGLDTEIGEKGVKLSGGERQRIAIARLLIQDPDIIILDEPTSALDSFSEDSIKKALKNLTQGKTVITIAHRLQTIVNSDIIYIFDNGEIIDQGNHKELLKKSDTYKRLIDLQNGRVY